jgi:hypothetical protein
LGLMKSRQEAAKTWYDNQWAEFVAGRVALDNLFAAGRALLKAELERGATKDKRVTARQDHLDRISKILTVNQARYNAGRASITDFSASRYEALDAEIELEREKRR